MEDLPLFGTVIDKSQVPSIHQKRILAFINHFTINTTVFLNKFLNECENKFVNFESKLKKVEASLLIVEAKLNSIPGLESTTIALEEKETKTLETPTSNEIFTTESPGPETTSSTSGDTVDVQIKVDGVAAKNDVRYKKYFKMVHFGVPAHAVKLKMKAEGLDDGILDNPEQILEDGMVEEEL